MDRRSNFISVPLAVAISNSDQPETWGRICLGLPSLCFYPFQNSSLTFQQLFFWLCPPIHQAPKMIYNQNFHCLMLYHGYSLPLVKSHENGKFTSCWSLLPSFKYPTKSACFCSLLRAFRIFIFYL